MRWSDADDAVRAALKERLSSAWRDARVLPGNSSAEAAFTVADPSTVLLTLPGEPKERLARRREEAERAEDAGSVFLLKAREPLLSSRSAEALALCARASRPVLLLADAPPPGFRGRDHGEVDLVRFGSAGCPVLVVRPGADLAAALDRMALAIDETLADPIVAALEKSAPGLLFHLALEILDGVRIADAPEPDIEDDMRPEPVTPSFGLLNKQYSEPPFETEQRRRILAHTLQALALQFRTNTPDDADAFLADEMLVWFRHLGFLKDERFQRALGPYHDDKILRARLWRLHTLCWATQACAGLNGDFADLGTYDGRSMDVVMRFLPGGGQGRRWWLYDLFDNPPEEARKVAHGPNLRDEVAARFRDRPWVRVVGGALPGTFLEEGPERIAFMHLDLNHAEAERACIEAAFERVVPGGMVVLDDFGSQRYADSHRTHREFFDAMGIGILELPTGQGLIVKQ